MNKTSIKLILISIFTLGLLTLAILRVVDFTQNSRSKSSKSSFEQSENHLATNVPEYDMTNLNGDVEELHQRLQSQVKAVLQALPSDTRPSVQESSAIASAYTRFVMINRVGSRLEYLSQYPHKSSKFLMLADSDRSDQVWAASSAWARHQPIQVESIHVACRYKLGSEKMKPPYGTGNMIKSRPLTTGGFLMADGARSYSVYEIVLGAVIPSLDGMEEFAVEIGAALINDLPQGEWSVVEVRFIGLPKGKYASYPFP